MIECWYSGATGGKDCVDQVLAHVGLPSAAILYQKSQQLSNTVHVSLIADDATMSVRRHEASPIENGQMRRQGAGENIKFPSNVARSHFFRRHLDQQTKDIQSGLVCQGRECIESLIIFHISINTKISK